ncbi:MAG: serine/threonine protein kinase [Firmicutes bacterium]|nr:serine/threonine protein kinase [Bacillota bacterium]
MNNTLPVGSVLNERYRILSILGQGGMSNVYLVEDVKLLSRWALKEMTDVFPDADKAEVIEQFHREARILAGLKHPNLPRVFDCFEENYRHYLVMEYIEGKTLGEILEKTGVVEPEKAIQWAVCLCDVLDSLHKAGIIYRDLKPGNVMIDENNHLWLIDFGIARLFSGGKIHDTIIIGTPGFASPEHHGRAETDARSDIFSLGATLHYLVTGVDPQIIPFVFKKPAEINPCISASFSDIIMKAVSLDPSGRFQSSVEMKQALTELKKPVDFQPSGKPASSVPVAASTKPLSAEDNMEENKEIVFSTDLVKTETPPVVASGGIVAAGALILAGGVVTIPVIAGAAAVFVPAAVLARKYFRKAMKTPGNIRITINSSFIKIERGDIHREILWSEVTGLLCFYEKAAAGITVKKYKIFTEKGNFEYGDEVGNVENLNKFIVKMADLQVKSDNEEYKRYGRG